MFPCNFFLGLLLFLGALQVNIIPVSLCEDHFYALSGHFVLRETSPILSLIP